MEAYLLEWRDKAVYFYVPDMVAQARSHVYAMLSLASLLTEMRPTWEIANKQCKAEGHSDNCHVYHSSC